MDQEWLEMFEKLKFYYENKQFDFKKGLTDEDLLLKYWIKKQRIAYKNRYIALEARKYDVEPLTDLQVRLLESIGLDWILQKDSSTFSWCYMYSLAKEYFLSNNNLNIPSNYKVGDFNLGSWIQTQRKAYQNRTISKEKRVNRLLPLTDEQVKLLEDIGMVWEANRWMMMYELAKRFYIENNHLEISSDYVTEDGYKLGLWIFNQQVAYKNRMIPKEDRNNHISPLTDEQVALLGGIKIKWLVDSKIRSSWYVMYELAKDFYLKNGHLEVPSNYMTENGYNLGNWIRDQRKAYKNRTVLKWERKNNLRPLTDEQVRLLDSIEMVWYATSHIKHSWYTMYELAKRYYNEHGNLNIPQVFVMDGIKIGEWIHCQRIFYKNKLLGNSSKLTNEQIHLLEKIGMIWSFGSRNTSYSWYDMYGFAKEYYLKNNNLYISQDYVTDDGVKLGMWICNQKRSYLNRLKPELKKKNGRSILTDEQVSLLEGIGMIWDLREYRFVTQPLNKFKLLKLEKRFLEFLSDYIKDNKNEIESYDDVKRVTDGFMETLGNEENHFYPFTKVKK